MASFDGFEELHAAALDPVAADAAFHRLIFGVEIGLQEGLAERPHPKLDRFDLTPDPFAALGNDRRAVQPVPTAGEAAKLAQQLVPRRRARSPPPWPKPRPSPCPVRPTSW